MTGRVIIVTGANSGIGYETAKFLCNGGNEVILACRNEEKGKAAVGKILESNPNALASFMMLDLADLSSVRKFVEDFQASGKKLYALVNNAGIYPNKRSPRQFTKDNFELAMGTNHLGHFLLTNLLLGNLESTASEIGDARIVTVTSMLHDRNLKKRMRHVTAFDIDDIFMAGEGKYSADNAYKNSKLANVLFTYELAKQLQDRGVTANCVCPGFIPATNLSRNATASTRFFIRYVLGGMFRFTKITQTVDQGARAVVELVTDEKFKGVNGKYFKNHAEARSSDESMDEELRVKLWELSARYCHLKGYEPLDAELPAQETEEATAKPKENEGTEAVETSKDEVKDKEEKSEKEVTEEKSEVKDEEKKEEETDKTEEKTEEKDKKEDTEEKKEMVSDEKVTDEKIVAADVEPAKTEVAAQ